MKISSQLIASRMQLHYAVQLMAATAMGSQDPQPDGSHVAFDWDPKLSGFVGSKLSHQSIRVGLDPLTLTSWILGGEDRKLATLELSGHSLATALEWHRQQLTELGLNTETMELLRYPDDFVEPALDFIFEGSHHPQERQILVNYFSWTRPLLANLAATAGSPIHTWPHHFDMATLINLNGSDADAPTIGIGLSPGDQTYPQPYWYVSPWPYPPVTRLASLSLGSWHTEGWVGAVLRADEVGDPTLASTQQMIKAFWDDAVSICYEILEALWT